MRLRGRVGHGITTSVAISRDGKFVVSGSGYGSIAVWEVNKDGLKHRFTVQASTAGVTGVSS